MENLKFSLTIECVFNVLTKGILVTGIIEQGCIELGNKLELIGGNSMFPQCTMLELYRRKVKKAHEGDYIAIYLSGIEHSDIKKGMQLVIRE